MSEEQSAQQNDTSPVVVQPVDMTADAPVVSDDAAVSDGAATSDDTTADEPSVRDALQMEVGDAGPMNAPVAPEAEVAEPEMQVDANGVRIPTEEPIVDAAEMNKTQKIIESTENDQAIEEIAAKIDEVQNILIALSNDPTADEISAAIGLALALEKMGKRATAIYSGRTPDILRFLKPEKTLEENADSLQDFIVELNKNKADHLRYKVEGEFVRIYITPYKVKLTPDDLAYAYGDYNVDLVIALNVRSATELDEVLRVHGRIMHDASAINITPRAPGRFAEIEWSNSAMSSVSEMVTDLLVGMKKPELDEDIATPLLAGIVAATERFKNEHTMPETMRAAGRLMDAGANEVLVAANITGDGVVDEGIVDLNPEEPAEPEPEEVVIEPEVVEPEPEPEPDPLAPVDAPLLNAELMEELRRQQEEANKPPEEPKPLNVKDYGKMIDDALAELAAAAPAEPTMETETPAAGEAGVPDEAKKIEVTEPEAEPVSEPVIETAVEPVVAEEVKPEEDGALQAAAEVSAGMEPEDNSAPEEIPVPEVSDVTTTEPTVEEVLGMEPKPEMLVADAPAEAGKQEEVPEPELPMPSDDILPPPPAPEVDFATQMPSEPMPGMDPGVTPEETAAMANELRGGANGAVEVPNLPENNAPRDPGEFRIPGM